MANEYVQGDLVRVSASFEDENGAASDPSGVKLDYKIGRAAKVTLTHGTDAELVKDSTGNYHADIDTSDSSGILYYRWYATGTGQTSEQAWCAILPSRP